MLLVSSRPANSTMKTQQSMYPVSGDASGMVLRSIINIGQKGLLGRNLGNPKYDWCFNTIPQKYVNNRTIWQPRGKGLGGCSMVSTLICVLLFPSAFANNGYISAGQFYDLCTTVER